MGWSKGKGLGANEDGSKDFVRVRMRNNNEGLGFEDRDDHWTQHEQDFNGLLKTLNGEDEGKEKAKLKQGEVKESASDEETPRVGFGFASELKKPTLEKLKDKISGVSLEQKSKLSKSRVHYQKFTKGKDIAQYSEKDLANIFGKKVIETKQADGVYVHLTAIMTKEDDEILRSPNREEKEVKPDFAGVQTISTGLSVSDYFKQKMETLKSKQKQNNNSNYIEQTNAEIIDVQVEEPTENKKKFKKRKQLGEAVEAGSQSTEANSLKVFEDNTALDVEEKKHKHRKKKRNTEDVNDKPLNEIDTEAIDNLPASKKDKRKKKDIAIKTVHLMDEVDIDVAEVPKKKKKSSEKKIEQHTNQIEVIEENKEKGIIASEAPKKKKKKSKESKSEQSQEGGDVIGDETPTSSEVPEHTSQSESPADEIKVKKNKKSKNRENSEENTEESSTLTATISKKFKKQKNFEKTLKARESEVSVDAEKTTEKPKKSKKDVSEDNQALTLDELIAKCNSFNIYTISSFVAEKFRNVDLECFKGSTITHLSGYTNTEDLQLKVVNKPKDEERITRLWNCSLDKYVEVNPKAIFGKYRQNILNAYKTKKQGKKLLPLFNIKSLKRKSVFQPI